MRQIALSLALLVLLVSGANSARADVIYNNFGPGDSYNHSIGWTVGLGFGRGEAFPIVPTSDFNLDTVTVAVGYVSGPNAVDVSVTTDVGGVPGAALETFHLTNLGPFGNETPVTATSTSHPLLPAGQSYFVTVTALDSTWEAWSWSLIDLSHPGAELINGRWTPDNGTSGAFRVTGTMASPVPEPASCVLLGMGALGLVGYGWRRRKMVVA